jgi:DNA-binding NarL/FixJ family response regulator
MANTRVLLVDDQPLIRQVLTRILADYADVEVVGQAASGDEAVSSVETLKPHIIIMDVRMPKMDGIAATREIKNKYPYVQILALTEFGHGHYAEEMLRAGALAVYQKVNAFEELYPAISKIAALQPKPHGGN